MYLGHWRWGPIQDIDAGRARATNGSLEASEGNAQIWLVRWAYEKGETEAHLYYFHLLLFRECVKRPVSEFPTWWWW